METPVTLAHVLLIILVLLLSTVCEIHYFLIEYSQ